MGHLTFVSKRLPEVGSKRISQFFDLNRCIVFYFIFYCVTAHTFVSRERIASFLNFVPVDLETTKTVFVFSTAVQIVDTEIS